MFETKIQHTCIDCNANITKIEKDEHNLRCEKCYRIYVDKNTPEGIANEIGESIETNVKTATLVAQKITEVVKDNPELGEAINELMSDVVGPVLNSIANSTRKDYADTMRTKTTAYVVSVNTIRRELQCSTEDAMAAANMLF